MVERQLAGFVGGRNRVFDSRPREVLVYPGKKGREAEIVRQVGGSRGRVFDESAMMDDVVYPATTTQLWRQVGKKKLMLEPKVEEYEEWDMGPAGWKGGGGYPGPAAYGPPPPPRAYMMRR